MRTIILAWLLLLSVFLGACGDAIDLTDIENRFNFLNDRTQVFVAEAQDPATGQWTSPLTVAVSDQFPVRGRNADGAIVEFDVLNGLPAATCYSTDQSVGEAFVDCRFEALSAGTFNAVMKSSQQDSAFVAITVQ